MGIYSEMQSESKKNTVLEELVLSNKKPALVPLIFLGILTALFTLFVPTLFILIGLSDRVHFGQLLGVVVSVFAAAFFLKYLLWNLYGREIIQVEPDRIVVFYDYKYFFGKRTELTGTQFYCNLYDSERVTSELRELLDQLSGQQVVKFSLRNGNAQVMSHHSIALNELVHFFDRVNSTGERTITIE